MENGEKRDVREEVQRGWEHIGILKKTARQQAWLECGGEGVGGGRLEVTQGQITQGL